MMRVLIVDDSEIVKERLISMISEQEGVHIVGQGQNGIDMLKDIKQYKPDAVILDIRVPGESCSDVLQGIKHIDPNIKVIMSTNYSYSQYRTKFLKSGADYFLDKSTEFHKIPEIIGHLAQDIQE